MKKTLFVIVIISIFALNGLVFAKTSPASTGSSEDMWFAINDLRNQVTSLQAELKMTKSQDSSETTITPADTKKSSQKIIVEKGDDISRSEHYIMKGFSIP